MIRYNTKDLQTKKKVTMKMYVECGTNTTLALIVANQNDGGAAEAVRSKMLSVLGLEKVNGAEKFGSSGSWTLVLDGEFWAFSRQALIWSDVVLKLAAES